MRVGGLEPSAGAENSRVRPPERGQHHGGVVRGERGPLGLAELDGVAAVDRDGPGPGAGLALGGHVEDRAVVVAELEVGDLLALGGGGQRRDRPALGCHVAQGGQVAGRARPGGEHDVAAVGGDRHLELDLAGGELDRCSALDAEGDGRQRRGRPVVGDVGESRAVGGEAHDARQPDRAQVLVGARGHVDQVVLGVGLGQHGGAVGAAPQGQLAGTPGADRVGPRDGDRRGEGGLGGAVGRLAVHDRLAGAGGQVERRHGAAAGVAQLDGRARRGAGDHVVGGLRRRRGRRRGIVVARAGAEHEGPAGQEGHASSDGAVPPCRHGATYQRHFAARRRPPHPPGDARRCRVLRPEPSARRDTVVSPGTRVGALRVGRPPPPRSSGWSCARTAACGSRARWRPGGWPSPARRPVAPGPEARCRLVRAVPCVLQPLIWSARARAASSSSSAGTTRDTSPMSAASAAPTSRPDSMISNARDEPMARGRRNDRPSSVAVSPLLMPAARK